MQCEFPSWPNDDPDRVLTMIGLLIFLIVPVYWAIVLFGGRRAG